MNAGPRQSALRELQQFFLSARFWLTIALVVLVFTVTGPFGTRESMPPLQRLTFWTLLHSMAFSIAITVSTLVNLVLEKRIGSKLAGMMIGSGLAALPIGFGIMLLQMGFFGMPLSLDEALTQAAVSLPLCLCLCLLTYLTTAPGTELAAAVSPVAASGEENGAPPSAPPAPPVAADQRPALLSRLKPDQRGQILHISVEDHYTRVVTSRGGDLILLRFSDALTEVGTTAGQRIHRSHWVADDYVAAVRREKGKLFIVTRDGTELPVSRPYAPQIRARYGKAEATEAKKHSAEG